MRGLPLRATRATSLRAAQLGHREWSCGSLSESGPRTLSSPSTVDPEALTSVETCWPCLFPSARASRVPLRSALACVAERPSASVTYAAPRARPERIRASLGPPLPPGRRHRRTEAARSEDRATVRTASRRTSSPTGLRLPGFPWAPAGVMGRKLRPEHPLSPLLHRPEAKTPSDGSVELPSRNLSCAYARVLLNGRTESLSGLGS